MNMKSQTIFNIVETLLELVAVAANANARRDKVEYRQARDDMKAKEIELHDSVKELEQSQPPV